MPPGEHVSAILSPCEGHTNCLALAEHNKLGLQQAQPEKHLQQLEELPAPHDKPLKPEFCHSDVQLNWASLWLLVHVHWQ